MKQNERRQKIENLEEKYKNLGTFSEVATTNKIFVNRVNLLEIKDGFLLDYTCDFEMIDETEQRTNIRFRNVEDFETYINAIDVDYDSGDVISSRWS